jgi:hypothetical protein
MQIDSLVNGGTNASGESCNAQSTPARLLATGVYI